MRRVSIGGNSGSGKTTLARALAARLGVPHLELDSIMHQPGWTQLPADDFQARVRAFLADATDGWVIDGNYRTVRPLVFEQADTIVWFDLPRRTVMRQLLTRTVRRGVTGEVLWNGNTERLRNLVKWDPHESIMRWAWTSHHACRRQYLDAAGAPGHAHLRFVRLRSHADAAALLAAA